MTEELLIPPLAEMLAKQFGQTTINIPAIRKALFKGTSAGVNMHIVDEQTIVITSIVENGDQGVTGKNLSWPFTAEEFWNQVEEVNLEACHIFEENKILNELLDDE